MTGTSAAGCSTCFPETNSLYMVLFLSGAAGLGYQMVWTRMSSVGLGHEMPSVMAVVGASCGGLALGAWLLDTVISRSRMPGLWYVGLESLIGVWGIASLTLIPLANSLAGRLIGVEPSPLWQWLVSFGIPLLSEVKIRHAIANSRQPTAQPKRCG